MPWAVKHQTVDALRIGMIERQTFVSYGVWEQSMDQKYNPEAVEKKWQSYWENEKIYKVEADVSREKYYVLEMFPYPSGRIHMGHVRNYCIGDVLARFKMMQGYNVLHPMGWMHSVCLRRTPPFNIDPTPLRGLMTTSGR